MISLEDILIFVGAIAGASVAAFIIWNSSKKVASLEFQLREQRENFSKDISELKETRNELIVEYNDRLSVNIKELTKDIADARIERREEIQKAMNSDKELISALQRQIDNTKSDIKDVAARVIIVNTKIDHVEKDIIELKKCDQENMRFFEVWNQRIEDRVEAVRTELGKFRSEFIQMFSAFHGNDKK